MSVTKTVINGNTKVSFEYTAATQKVTDTMSDAAKNLYLQGFTAGVVLGAGETVDDLTNGEIGTILDFYIQRTFVGLAKEYHINTSMGLAKTTAESENLTRYI